MVGTTWIVAGAAGVIAHVGLFNRGEWHMKGPHIVVSHVLLIIANVLLDLRPQASSQILPHVSCLFSCYACGVFLSIAVYRLSPFHRLHHFPGPRLAAVSKIWHVWQCRDSRNHELMRKLYEEFGDFVRIGRFFCSWAQSSPNLSQGLRSLPLSIQTLFQS